MDEFSFCELGDITFTWGRVYERQRGCEAEVYECLDCGSLVINKESHIQWHEQMGAVNAT